MTDLVRLALKTYLSLHFQGDDEQEAEGDCGAGAELRQFQPAAPQGAARRAQQLRRALPERKKVS